MDKAGRWAIRPFSSADYSSSYAKYFSPDPYNFLVYSNHIDSNFSEGLALVRQREYNDRARKDWRRDYAYIDRTGKIVFELKGYINAKPFHEGLAKVSPEIGTVRFMRRGWSGG